MASPAIHLSGPDGAPEYTDVIPPPAGRRPAKPVRKTGGRSRLPLAALCVGALGCLGAVAGAGYLVLSGPSFLAGFAFSPGPGAPKREAIRMGRVPDMPEIRNGVPELVARAPVRVIQAATSPPAVATSEPEPPRPVVAVPAPRATALVAEPVSTSSLPSPSRPMPGPVSAAAAESARTSAALLSGTPSVPVPAVLVPRPAETAAVPVLASVPLPPPAPRLSLARAAVGPSVKPERTAVVAGGGAAPQKIARAQVGDPLPGGAPDAATEDEHVNVFGVNVPTIGSTGRKLRDAMGALGDAFVSLPGKF